MSQEASKLSLKRGLLPVGLVKSETASTRDIERAYGATEDYQADHSPLFRPEGRLASSDDTRIEDAQVEGYRCTIIGEKTLRLYCAVGLLTSIGTCGVVASKETGSMSIAIIPIFILACCVPRCCLEYGQSVIAKRWDPGKMLTPKECLLHPITTISAFSITAIIVGTAGALSSNPDFRAASGYIFLIATLAHVGGSLCLVPMIPEPPNTGSRPQYHHMDVFD